MQDIEVALGLTLDALDAFYKAADAAGSRTSETKERLRLDVKSAWKDILSADIWPEVELNLAAIGKEPFAQAKRATSKRSRGQSSSGAAPSQGAQPQPAPHYQQPLYHPAGGPQPMYAQPAYAAQPQYVYPAQPWQHGAGQQQLQPAQPAQLQPAQAQSSSAPRVRPPCTVCGGTTHNASRCWKAFPHLAPDYVAP